MKILIQNGRVIDPASGLDKVCNVALAAGRIIAVDREPKDFTPSRVIDAGGIGLTNMDDRARLLGGALDIRTAPGAGTCVALAVHLARSQEETGGSHAA